MGGMAEGLRTLSQSVLKNRGIAPSKWPWYGYCLHNRLYVITTILLLVPTFQNIYNN